MSQRPSLLESIKGHIKERPDQVKLTETTFLADFEPSEIKDTLSALYKEKSLFLRLLATVLNSIFTQRRAVFLFSRPILQELLKRDENVMKRKTLNGTEFKELMINLDKKFFRRLACGKKDEQQASVHKLVHAELLSLLQSLVSDDTIKSQEEQCLQVFNSYKKTSNETSNVSAIDPEDDNGFVSEEQKSQEQIKKFSLNSEEGNKSSFRSCQNDQQGNTGADRAKDAESTVPRNKESSSGFKKNVVDQSSPKEVISSIDPVLIAKAMKAINPYPEKFDLAALQKTIDVMVTTLPIAEVRDVLLKKIAIVVSNQKMAVWESEFINRLDRSLEKARQKHDQFQKSKNELEYGEWVISKEYQGSHGKDPRRWNLSYTEEYLELLHNIGDEHFCYIRESGICLEFKMAWSNDYKRIWYLEFVCQNQDFSTKEAALAAIKERCHESLAVHRPTPKLSEEDLENLLAKEKAEENRQIQLLLDRCRREGIKLAI